MELTYTKGGDYYRPDLTLGDQPDKPLGWFGRKCQEFLEEHHPGTYNRLMLLGKLWAHLVEIDTACKGRMEALIPAMATPSFPLAFLLSLCPVFVDIVTVFAMRTAKLGVGAACNKYPAAMITGFQRAVPICQHETEHHLQAQQQRMEIVGLSSSAM